MTPTSYSTLDGKDKAPFLISFINSNQNGAKNKYLAGANQGEKLLWRIRSRKD
ncbi:hypothetical protein ACPWUF_10280 [Bisgaard Taxon 46]